MHEKPLEKAITFVKEKISSHIQEIEELDRKELTETIKFLSNFDFETNDEKTLKEELRKELSNVNNIAKLCKMCEKTYSMLEKYAQAVRRHNLTPVIDLEQTEKSLEKVRRELIDLALQKLVFAELNS
ncbi:MAG: hypothetical protein ACPLTR_03845 [Thermacetogeniaceae bacterium]